MDALRTKSVVSSLPARALIAFLRDGQCVRFRALGGSMWPTIRHGAWVKVIPCPASALQAGDLAAYAPDDSTLVVHRVLRPLHNGVITFCGDALDHEDPPIPAEQVLGRAIVEAQRPLTLRLPRGRELACLLRLARRRVVDTVRRTFALRRAV